MNILLIDDRIPDSHFGAGFPRAYRLLLSLTELGHNIFFFPTTRQNVGEINHEILRNYRISAYDDLHKITAKIDVAILSRPHNVHYFLPTVKSLFPEAKIIYDTEALWYRRYDLQMSITGRLPNWAHRYDELGLARQVDLCFVVNEIEQKILEENGAKKVVKLAHAIDLHKQGKPFNQRQDFLVVGGILETDSSNEDALVWYLENAWKHVYDKIHANMIVTGSSPSSRLQEKKWDGVELVGHISNLIPLYEEKRVFVAATRFATGIPWKCHEAMAHGIPCIISQLLADQLQVTNGKEAMVAKNETEFIEKSILLYQDEQLWHYIRNNAFKLVKRDCNPARFKHIVATTLSELVV